MERTFDHEERVTGETPVGANPAAHKWEISLPPALALMAFTQSTRKEKPCGARGTRIRGSRSTKNARAIDNYGQ